MDGRGTTRAVHTRPDTRRTPARGPDPLRRERLDTKVVVGAVFGTVTRLGHDTAVGKMNQALTQARRRPPPPVISDNGSRARRSRLCESGVVSARRRCRGLAERGAADKTGGSQIRTVTTISARPTARRHPTTLWGEMRLRNVYGSPKTAATSVADVRNPGQRLGRGEPIMKRSRA